MKHMKIRSTAHSHRRRRTLLQAGAVALAALTLAACTSGGGGTTDPTGDGSPVQGGTLRVGGTGGGTSDTLDAQYPLTTMDFMRVGAIFEQLVKMGAETGQPEYVLAESITPNDDATEWTIKIKPDITFHDGSELTADDVLFSLERIEENGFYGLKTMGPVDLSNATVVDDLTLTVPMTEPYAIFVEGLADIFATRIVPEGYDPANPIGTGPFKFESFTAGQESVFVRNDDYWQEGKPYLDELVIINFADETAQVNALQSGEVDVINQLSAPSVAAVESAGAKTVVSQTRGFVPMYMKLDVAPFDDVRVREALRLIADRDAINEQVYGGFGAVGNDVFGAIDPAYQGAVEQRTQDIERAKELLADAGQSDLTVDLYTTATGPGAESMASVFATQAQEAGVTVNIIKQDPTQYWSQSYSQVPFGLTFWNTSNYLTQAAQGLAVDATWPETNQDDPEWNALFDEAVQTLDPAARDAIIQQMIQWDWQNGGYIIPVYFPGIEGMTANVEGISSNITGFPINGSSGWENIWLGN